MKETILGAVLIFLGMEYYRRRFQDTTYVTVACGDGDDDGEADDEAAPAEPDGGKALTLAESMGWAG